MPITAAHTLVASLRGHGVDRVFCVAGESYLAVLDALADTDIDVVTCRHEGSAAFMAVTDARLTGRAGICLVSRGPGAANASVAVHAAAEDAAPLVLLVGDVAERNLDKDTFQSFDPGRFFGGMAKAVWRLHDPSAAGEFIARAFRVAESGTPGPVVVSMPEDVIRRDDPVHAVLPRTPAPAATAEDTTLEQARRMLAGARRPVLLAGAALDDEQGRELLRVVADRHDLPVVTSNKRQHLLPNRHPAYAGHLHNATQGTQLKEFQRADLVLAVGTRLDWVTTKGHRFPTGEQPLIHVHRDPARIGAWRRTELAVAADPHAFLRELSTWDASAPEADWRDGLHRIEADKAVWTPVEADDGVVFGSVMSALDDLTGGELTLVVDSGTFTSWAYRYIRFGERGRLIGLTSSTMGFGIGAGTATAMRATGDVPTVVLIGDGGFVMNPGELAVACARRLPVVFIVANNGSYGTIRAHQQRRHPGRVIGTDLSNPDFARLASSFGALGLTIHSTEQIRPCLAKALDFGGPAVVEVRTSLRHLSPYGGSDA